MLHEMGKFSWGETWLSACPYFTPPSCEEYLKCKVTPAPPSVLMSLWNITWILSAYIPCFAGLYLLHFSQAVVLHEVDNLLQSLAVHAHIFTQFLSTLVEFLKECKMAPVPHADDELAVSLLDIIWISSLHPMLCRLVFFFASRNSQKIWFRDVMRCSAWCAREVSTDKECVSDASGQQEPFEVWCKQSFEIRWLGPI